MKSFIIGSTCMMVAMLAVWMAGIPLDARTYAILVIGFFFGAIAGVIAIVSDI